MGDNELRIEDLVFGSRNGFVFVAVPPAHAAEVKRRLKTLGIGSSLHALEQGDAKVLHPHTNLAPDRVRALLAGQGWPRRRGADQA